MISDALTINIWIRIGTLTRMRLKKKKRSLTYSFILHWSLQCLRNGILTRSLVRW